MSSVTFVQNVMAVTATESAQGEIESGSEGFKRAESQRKDNTLYLEKKQRDIKKLEEEIRHIGKRSKFRKFVGGLFGSDGGASKAAHKMERAGADMKKTQQEMVAAQARVDLLMNELQNTQSDLVRRQEDHQKIFDEQAQAQKIATS